MVKDPRARLAAPPPEAEWIEAHRKLFAARFDALDKIVLEMKQEEEDESAGK